MEPVPFGFRMTLFYLAILFCAQLRTYIRRENGWHVAIAAMFLNTLFYIVLTFIFFRQTTVDAPFVQRWLIDLSLSTIVIGAMSHSYIQFQRIYLLHNGTNVAAEIQQ
jgi:hypothetical protein